MNMKKSTISPWSWIKLQAHRSIAKGGWYQFASYAIIVGVLLGVLALCFSLSCNYLWAVKDYSPKNPVSAAFFHLFTNGGENKLGNLPFGWLVTVIGVIMVAILTSLFTNSFDKIGRRYLDGETHYSVKNHVAVFGYHEMLPGLLKQLFSTEEEQRLFFIQTTQVEKARCELSRVLTKRQMRRVILQNGEIVSGIDLPYMHVGKACEIIILGEEMNIGDDSAHDTAVLQCLTNIVDSLPTPDDKQDKVLCQVMFEHHSTFAIFQHTDLNNSIMDKLAFLPFNYYEMWARKVFVNDSLTPVDSEDQPYLPLEGMTGIDKDSEDHIHLIVIGMSRMGIAMGIQAAHLAHYPNFIRNPKCKTRITFIDRDARTEMYHLQGRMEAMFQTAGWRYVEPDLEDYGYSTSNIDKAPWHNPMTDDDSMSPYKSQNDYLGKDFLDVEWEFIQADEKNPAVQEYIREMAEDEHTRLTIAVCVPDSDQAIAIGVNLPPAVYESAVQVLIYQQKGDAIVRKLSGSAIAGHSYYAKVHPFGMSSDGYDLDLVHKLVFIAANANKEGEQSLQHMLTVDVAKQLQKASESKSAAANMWSNIYYASHIWTKLRSIGSKDGSLSEEDVAILGQTEHIRWNVEQLLTQYRPLTETEQVAIQKGKASKIELKRERLAHLNIASLERLETIDPRVIPYDFDMVRAIPGMYRHLQDLQ